MESHEFGMLAIDELDSVVPNKAEKKINVLVCRGCSPACYLTFKGANKGYADSLTGCVTGLSSTKVTWKVEVMTAAEFFKAVTEGE